MKLSHRQRPFDVPNVLQILPASCLCSVCYNNITGDAAETLANVVLEHATLTIFCHIPLTSLRENSIEVLKLQDKGIGVPGAIVLSKLLISNSSLKSVKCVDHSFPHCSVSSTHAHCPPSHPDEAL